jgi:alkaline phosphatase D
MDRRALLVQAAAAASTLWLPRSSWAQAQFQDAPFALGVASGSPTHDSVVLWTRLAHIRPAQHKQDITVQWELAHDAQFQRMVRSGQATAPAILGHSVHVDLQGLEPDRWYHYRFQVGGATSPVGRTRTFPLPGAEVARLRLAYASCQHWEHGHYSAYRHMLAEDLDVVMFLGDYIYEYSGSRDAVRPSGQGTALTLDDYRARYALYKSDPDLQRMHQTCPWLLTWDDHEVQNDYAGVVQGSRGPQGVDFVARRAAAYQAYYEHMPLRAAALGRALNGVWGAQRELRLYDRVPFGRLANLHLLDDRQYRDPQACTKGGDTGSSTVNLADCAALADPQRTLLGAAQERWLAQSLARNAGRWTVLGQQTVFGLRDFKRGPDVSVSNDGWDGYPAARSRVTDALQRHSVSNPVFLGGDVHSNWVGQVKADYARPDSAAVGVEFCGTSITSRGGSNDRLPETLAENPHFVFANRERRGYGVAEFTPKLLRVALRVIDDVARADSGVETLAQFMVEAGQPKVHSA